MDSSTRVCARQRLSFKLLLTFALGITTADQVRAEWFQDTIKTETSNSAMQEAEFLTKTRQLTFEGRRAGEGYFSRDGKQLVFQSEREPGNPFFQIYVMDLETGDTEQVSPGHGKTTCAWIHPDGKRVLFASTHEDAAARAKQAQEIKARQEGKKKRYSWDYDEHFDLFAYSLDGGGYQRITSARGYDAEGSYSPDGKLIAFASNRRAYSDEMTEDQRELFEHDPSTMMEIYVMHADGSQIQQLTNTSGYDGGPFFSPDGKRICWRRFSENGAIAEVMTMNVDGSDKRQLTHLDCMSWAPFYHPSGKYLIFATNRHGFSNFELYLVDTGGKSNPVRVTHTDRFDGLAVFTPDGNQLAWTSGRTDSKRSHLFIANWNHTQALRRLGLASNEVATDAAGQAATFSQTRSSPGFSPTDMMRHVDYLCRDELSGRLTGTRGEALATAYVAAYFDRLGLVPAGREGFFQNFEFTSGVALGPNNRLTLAADNFPVDDSWRPVSFSETGTFSPTPVVFAGYGIVAPAAEGHPEYDSFVHLDVKDKWILVFRYLPGQITPEQRQQWARYSSLRFKTMVARDKGARGLIVVSGPNSEFKHQLVKLQIDGTLSGSSLPVISITDEVAEKLLASSGQTLQKLQDRLDTGEPMMGFPLTDVELSVSVDIQQIKMEGRNVLGRLHASDQPSDQVVVVGAHIDHLGKGPGGSSLARENEQEMIHYGADDNASGVAALLEVAEYLSDQRASGKLQLKRDVLFAAWSGEELGLLGSSHFVKSLIPVVNSGPHDPESPTADHAGSGHGPDNSIYPGIAACINMDMVGRLQNNLVLHGVGSSSIWPAEIERRNAPIGLSISAQNDSYIPTDASVFFMRGVPILSAFTGSHEDYHTPRDTPEKLNYEGAARIARFMGLVTRSLALRDQAPDYISQAGPEQEQRRANLRAYLGTIPDYSEEAEGVKLSGVAKGGPAAKSGLLGGDVIVELAGKKIENIYDYTYAIEALKAGESVKISVTRKGERLEMEITPGSRD
ncbi:MAG: peptidase M28 [Planctomycetaceae bacterium]|nr:peptidase M28 [Planctomycetaceae bacterium]